jgi:hypothetical protein
MSGENCTDFMEGAEWDSPLCRCPKCSGFLPRHIPDEFTCKKCGEKLYLIYGDDKGTFGKICKIPDSLKESF